MLRKSPNPRAGPISGIFTSSLSDRSRVKSIRASHPAGNANPIGINSRSEVLSCHWNSHQGSLNSHRSHRKRIWSGFLAALSLWVPTDITRKKLRLIRQPSKASGSTNTPVTNEQFARFIEATGHVTSAERAPNPEDYPGALPGLLKPASVVFNKPKQRVDLRDHYSWWTYIVGADWRHPEGPESSIADRAQHPVVHLAYEDAEAYAKWAGKQFAYRSRVGICRTRRSGRRRLRLGRRTRAWR